MDVACRPGDYADLVIWYMKVILPGEMGVVHEDQIGTFAVGSGCRGYLILDEWKPLAGVAHVDSDSRYPDVQDAIAVYDLINALLGMGARDLLVRSTRNADLDQVLGQLGGHGSVCLIYPIPNLFMIL